MSRITRIRSTVDTQNVIAPSVTSETSESFAPQSTQGSSISDNNFEISEKPVKALTKKQRRRAKRQRRKARQKAAREQMQVAQSTPQVIDSSNAHIYALPPLFAEMVSNGLTLVEVPGIGYEVRRAA